MMSSSLCANHALSVFKNSCRSAPVKNGSSNSRNSPRTAPSAVASTSLPNLSDTCKGRLTGGDDWSGPAVPKVKRVKKTSPPPPPSPIPPTEAEVKTPDGDNYATLFQTLLDSNTLLHKEITKLRRDHKKAMSRLTDIRHDHGSARQVDAERCMQCRSSRTKEEKSPCDRPHAHIKGSWESGSETHLDKSHKRQGGKKFPPKYDADKSSMSEECYEPSVMYDTPEEFHFDGSDDSDKLSIKSIESYQITYISSSSSSSSPNVSSCSSRYGSPQMLVGKMWEGFSVGDYPVEDFSEAFPNKDGGRSKQWAPRTTVPEPFAMTVREANTIKKKTKSMVTAEKEQEERNAALDSKCRRKFRATPIPANTYLPLYDLINAKNEQRKELVKKMSGNLVKSSQRPFKFSKRDEEKKQQKSEWLKQSQEQEVSRLKEKPFKAKPIPPQLFGPSVVEEIQEKEEYRKIRSRVRAEELLAKSKAPYSMRLQSAKGGEIIKLPPAQKPRGKSRSSYTARSSFTFQPRITHKIPDYKKTYERLQQQLLLKKQSKLTTVSEPFNLHTEKRAKTRQPVDATNTQSDSGIEDKIDKIPPSLGDAPQYTPVMTETARRRHLLTQERLEEALLKVTVAGDQLKARKKRQKDFQKIVAKKSSSFDLTQVLEEKKKIKMEKFRQKDRKNQSKYRQHLENIKKRVEARPLLLEQVSSHSTDIARTNYTTALTKVGFSKEEIEALLKDINECQEK